MNFIGGNHDDTRFHDTDSSWPLLILPVVSRQALDLRRVKYNVTLSATYLHAGEARQALKYSRILPAGVAT